MSTAASVSPESSNSAWLGPRIFQEVRVRDFALPIGKRLDFLWLFGPGAYGEKARAATRLFGLQLGLCGLGGGSAFVLEHGANLLP